MKNWKKYGWVFQGILLSACAALLFMSLYGSFHRKANAQMENPFETEDAIYRLYRNNQILYRELYNKVNDTSLDYIELYYPLEGGDETDLDAYQRYQHGEEVTEAELAPVYNYQATDSALASIRRYFDDLESEFGQFNLFYDYRIVDTLSNQSITNCNYEQLIPERYSFLMTFVYDENGNISIREVKGEDVETIRKFAVEYARSLNLPSDISMEEYADTSTDISFGNRKITNCSITYGMTTAMAESIMMGNTKDHGFFGYVSTQYNAYSGSGSNNVYMLFVTGMVLSGFLLPLAGSRKPWESFRIFRPSIEVLCLISVYLINMTSNVVSAVREIMTGQAAKELQGGLFSLRAAGLIAASINFLMLFLLFILAWYQGVCLKEIRELGFLGYFRRRCLCYQIFPYTRKKLRGFYQEIVEIDLSKDVKNTLIKLVVVNAVILFLISSLWVFGFVAIAVYSFVLYLLLKKYVSKLQEQYRHLLSATNEIAKGHLNITLPKELGVFEPFRPEISKIQKGFQKAVEEEVKSQRMKGELITNVSHDLKTPLTAIITYIDLLKEKDITPEKHKEYLDTLERKSLRLKALIEDLFEISKANSRAVKLELVEVDIFNLIKQAQLELSDKLSGAQLEVRMLLPKERIVLMLDSQKTFRIYENLFSNIAKYALARTRVYISAQVTEEEVRITLKNISAREIMISAEELTERFVRGDASRNTEGSGLGLAIAKSFAELQNGSLLLETDGDLFKVTTLWRRK